MRVGLDSSVVVRLLTGEPAPLALGAARRIEAAYAAGASLFVSDLVVAECYFALQYHYGVGKAEALEALRRLFRESPLRPLGAAGEVLEQPNLATAKPGFVDRLIHSGYRSAAMETWTFEKSAAKLPAVRLLAEP